MERCVHLENQQAKREITAATSQILLTWQEITALVYQESHFRQIPHLHLCSDH